MLYSRISPPTLLVSPSLTHLHSHPQFHLSLAPGKTGSRYNCYRVFLIFLFFQLEELEIPVYISVIQSCPTLCDLRTVAYQAPLSMEFSRQEYHLMQRANSLEKTLRLGKIEGKRRRGWQRMRWLDGITNSMNISPGDNSEGQGSLGCCSSWSRKESGHKLANEQQQQKQS